MLNFQWNALRMGDGVVMHEGAQGAGSLALGVVTAVSMQRGSNEVGIRLEASDGRRVIVWPSPLVVHQSAADDECWRCREVSQASASKR